MKKRICDAAVEILRETDNPMVGRGDSGLLHAIAERASDAADYAEEISLMC